MTGLCLFIIILCWVFLGLFVSIWSYTEEFNLKVDDIFFILFMSYLGPAAFIINKLADISIIGEKTICPFYDEPGMLIRCRSIPKDAVPFFPYEGCDRQYWKTKDINSWDLSNILIQKKSAKNKTS